MHSHETALEWESRHVGLRVKPVDLKQIHARALQSSSGVFVLAPENGLRMGNSVEQAVNVDPAPIGTTNKNLALYRLSGDRLGKPPNRHLAW
jgi:hypothetical protein